MYGAITFFFTMLGAYLAVSVISKIEDIKYFRKEQAKRSQP